VAEPAVVEFRAMGSPCRIVVEPGRLDAAEAARDLVRHLEQCWSRFLDDSEVSALNRSAGRLTIVSAETYDLVATAVRAQEATGGRFNPLMAIQLARHGYRRPWADGPAEPSSDAIAPATTEPIELYPEIPGVKLPQASGFDPGGIGKGLAVDRAIERCRSMGVSFASVELGGDLRVYGAPWYGDRWTIGVADPFDPTADVATFTPTEGALTTSTITKRRWFDGDRWRHHLLDPATGWPSETDLVTVATCSSEAWWAEVVAKTALLAGSADVLAVLGQLGTPGVAVTAAGTVLATSAADPVEVPA